jgi:hypothetical protein
MATYTGPDGEKLKLNYREDNQALRSVMAQGIAKIQVGDLFDTDDGLIPVVHKFLGANPNNVYEEVLSVDPPITFRRTLAMLAGRNGVESGLGGVLLKKPNSTNFIYLPFFSQV